jgi:hypothetical protein
VTAQACQQHPEQAAVGICVRCGAPFCDACLTKLDGINHCRSCLALLARTSARLVSLARGNARFDDSTRAARGKADALHDRKARLHARARQVLAWLGLGLGVALLAALAFFTLNAVLPAGAP